MAMANQTRSQAQTIVFDARYYIWNCICEKGLCYRNRRRKERRESSRDFVKMLPLSTRVARKKTESALLSYSRQRLPRPARLYSSPTNRASAQAFDAADSYPAFLPAHPKLADPTGNVPDNSNTSDMHTFLRTRTPYTILPPPLPQDKDSELNDLLYTDSPTQDLISVMDACLHNGYDVPRAKEIFDNLRARGAEQILHPRLYTAFVEAYLDMALKEPDEKTLWVDDAWTLLDLLFSGNEKVSVTSGAYALALVAWLRCVCASL
jgi:DNA-directed RNA polymerase